MFCVEATFGSLFILFINIKNGNEHCVQSRLWTCRVINLSCLAHCWSSVKCTVVVLSKSKMLLWKVFATWQCPFKLGKQLNSCLNSCIPTSSEEGQQHRLTFFSQRMDILPLFPDHFQHFTAQKWEHLILHHLACYTVKYSIHKINIRRGWSLPTVREMHPTQRNPCLLSTHG